MTRLYQRLHQAIPSELLHVNPDDISAKLENHNFSNKYWDVKNNSINLYVALFLRTPHCCTDHIH